MIPRHFTALVAATTALARTPEGFTPASNTDLIVEYSGFAPLNGAVVSRSGNHQSLPIPHTVTYRLPTLTLD